VWTRWWWWWGGCAFTNTRQERGLGAKNHETECGGLISGAPCQTAVEGNGGRWWWWGCAFVNVRWARGLGAKNHETECDGSVSGELCEIAVEGDGGRWWGGVNKVVVVVVGLHVRKHEVGEGAGVKKPETEPPWLDFGLHQGGGGLCAVTAPLHNNLWGVGTWE
jgi:hypothetical protein